MLPRILYLSTKFTEILHLFVERCARNTVNGLRTLVEPNCWAHYVYDTETMKPVEFCTNVLAIFHYKLYSLRLTSTSIRRLDFTARTTSETWWLQDQWSDAWQNWQNRIMLQIFELNVIMSFLELSHYILNSNSLLAIYSESKLRHLRHNAKTVNFMKSTDSIRFNTTLH